MTRTLVAVRHLLFEDLGLIAPVAVERGYDVRYVDAGIDPIDAAVVRDADVLVVLGGPIGVGDEAAYPFLTEERRVVADRIAAGRAVLGVCLGAQVIALALGADVRATGRVEIGYAPLTLTSEGRDGVLAPLADLPVLHWHGDEFAIPAGATRLAETRGEDGPGLPNQAFSVGDTVLALQFHLEADHTQIDRWLIGHAHELASAGIDPTTIREEARVHGPDLVERARRVLESWLDQLP